MVQTPPGTLAERYKYGTRLRKKAPREKHADLLGPADRDAPVILAETDRSRVPELVPIRYERMLASPFAFLRGAAAVMAEDLRHQPIAMIPVQACGDAHLMNFGAFATPEQNVLFDINDFDETLPGVDFTADLKRLTASVAVAASAAGISKKRARATATTTVEAYRSHIRSLAKLSPLENWHSRIELAREVERIDQRSLRRELEGILSKASDHLAEDDNFPHLVKGKQARIEDRAPLIYHFTPRAMPATISMPTAHSASMRAAWRPTGSVSWIDMRSRTLPSRWSASAASVHSAPSRSTCAGMPHRLFLQLKEAGHSVLERLAPKFEGHQGQRVVEGQRIMQAASDVFLGWTEDTKSHRQFYVRHLKNRRLGSIGELVEEEALGSYARLCGRTLARAHARSADPAVLAGYMGKRGVFDDALASFAMTYAVRTHSDYEQLVKAKQGVKRRAA